MLLQLPPRSTLFPYTTLFRSTIRPRLEFGVVPRPEVEGVVGELRDLDEPPVRREPGETHAVRLQQLPVRVIELDRKSTRLNSSHLGISYAVFCLKKKNKHRLF